ncbi:MAG: hypothetical protein KJ749_14530 [Planctomycetes bacterium]|nr:hypothetical protein [Planctomycetota bacterium]
MSTTSRKFLDGGRRARCLGAGLALIVAIGEVGVASEAGDDSVLTQFGKLIGDSGKLDWEAESQVISEAIDRLFAQSGWDSEPHRYARELVREVSAIPPWEMVRRLDVLVDRVSERYRLSPEQATRFRGLVLRETGSLLARHRGVILEELGEVLRTRAAGEPFTAEQIARWTKANAPLFQGLRESSDQVIKELSVSLDPPQRRILQRDVTAFDERWKTLEQWRSKWARGQWEPSEWGLEGGPAKAGSAAVGADSKAIPSAPSVQSGQDRPEEKIKQPTRWQAHDPSTWMAYIRAMERRYQLDASQVNAARSIHDELVERASAYIEGHAEQLRQVPLDQRPTHEQYEPVRALFDELEARVEGIPTSIQRENAAE